MTQIQWVKDRLDETGEISRNLCLQNYISRLGAIIAILKEEGYEFDAGYRKYVSMFGWGGKDYVYKATFIPERKDNA